MEPSFPTNSIPLEGIQMNATKYLTPETYLSTQMNDKTIHHASGP